MEIHTFVRSISEELILCVLYLEDFMGNPHDYSHERLFHGCGHGNSSF